MKLLNKAVLVTGASGDIGMACAKACMEEGATVILHSFRHPERVDSFIRSAEPNERLFHINCDATSQDEVRGCVESIPRLFGVEKIDVLVNNAGDLIERCAFAEMEWEFVQRVIDVNVKSAFLFTRYSLPLMRANSSVIFVASLTARCGKGDRSSAYGMAKGALLSLSRCLAHELGPLGIRVNCVAPGYIEGNFHQRYTAKSVEEEHAKRNPLGRVGIPAEVGQAVSMLAALGNGYVSGAVLDVCGADWMG